MGMTVDTIGECYATVSICGEEVKVKAQFLEVLKRYEGQCGSNRALAMQDKLEVLKDKVIEENEAVLEWLPLRKRDVTLETLLQKTYQSLVNDMERDMGEKERV